jgi:glycosyltransferase involved in cell wall biosynthesis
VSRHEGIEIRRAPVLRDSAGYVRGYAHYMSFDIPVFFRLLFSGSVDVVVVEPPPTTGFFVRLACLIRRIPYVYYAADIWADAVAMTNAPRQVVSVVRGLERWAMRGATAVISTSAGVTTRLAELDPRLTVTTVGNGVDTELFSAEGPARDLGTPYLLYAGTASEVHGAGIFLEAFRLVGETNPTARLVFVGQGAEREELERVAQTLPPDSVVFEPRLPPAEVAEWIRGAAATLASVKPGGYEFAFPTKMYASVSCGTRVIYAGVGPGREFADNPGVGWAVGYDVLAIAAAMRAALDAPAASEQHHQVAQWATANVSLSAVAERVVATVAAITHRT